MVDIIDNTIKIGDYLIIKRQNYIKLHKLKENSTLILGNFNICTNNLIGEQYFNTFQIKNDPTRGKNYYQLEKVITNNNDDNNKLLIKNKCGIDNRNIDDYGQSSQNLTHLDIKKLKEEQLNSKNIVEELIVNSKTFNKKTEYSQEKYIRKKEKKYFEYIEIKRPTIRLLATIFYRLESSTISTINNKNLNLRLDDLSQILTYSNIHTNGIHLLYDCGSNGLLSAAILNLIGHNTNGYLINLHPGNECQKLALLAMQYPNEQLQRCINVNIYSVLRCYYQNESSYLDDNNDNTNNDEPDKKRLKLENWQQSNIKACKLLKNNVDSLIIAIKDHPINIVKELIQFLNNNRNLIVYHNIKEPLIDLYQYLKDTNQFISIRIFDNFLRQYQILKNRTHPEMNMSTGGYILTAIKLNK